jgi:hypothetical protein
VGSAIVYVGQIIDFVGHRSLPSWCLGAAGAGDGLSWAGTFHALAEDSPL